MSTSREAATAVTAYLSAKGYGGTTPLEELVQQHVMTMAREIAMEIVNSTPQLREVIEAKTQEVIRAALQDNAALRGSVVRAVAEALSVRHHSDED